MAGMTANRGLEFAGGAAVEKTVRVSGFSPATESSTTFSRKEAEPRVCPAGMMRVKSSVTGSPSSSTIWKSAPLTAVSPGMVMVAGSPSGPIIGCPLGRVSPTVLAARPPKPRVRTVFLERAAPGPKEAVTVYSVTSSPSRTIPVNSLAAAVPDAPAAPAGGAGATCRVTKEGGASLSVMVKTAWETVKSVCGKAG